MRIIRSKSYLVDGLVVLTFSILFLVANLLRLDFLESLRHNDGWWYLNRAWLHSHGIFDEVSFYTLAYPLVVGAVNLLIKDLPLSAIIVNTASQFFLLLGVYTLGKQLVNRPVGLLSVLLLALNPSNLFHARLLNADLLFVAASVWSVTLAVQLARQPNQSTAIVLAMLLAAIPFIRTEGIIYGLAVLSGLAVVYLRSQTRQTIIRYALTVIPIVSLAWLGYLVWFLRGADAPSSVGDALLLAYEFDEPPWLFRLRRTLEILNWQLNRSDWLALLAGLVTLRIKALSNLIPILLIPVLILIYITFATPFPHSRYTFQLVPYFMIILAAYLVGMTQRFPLVIIVVTTLILATQGAILSIQHLPAPLAYLTDPRVVTARQIVDELAQWRAVNGHEHASIYTLCTDLMIFAQFDVRLPYTGLLFSSRRFAPPEQVLPQVAAQGDLLLVCPSFIGDLYNHPFNRPWTALYRYWSGAERDNPELADMARYPLEEVGRVREYIIYRVKPELQSAQ